MDGDDAPRGSDPGTEVRQRLGELATSLHATPAELAGLAALLLGGVVCLLVLVWWSQPAVVVASDVPQAAPTHPPGSGAATDGAPLTVHVVGAVAHPGVVVLGDGARVVDAVAAAGGPTVLAELGRLNLARPVTDGERIEVPEVGDRVSGTPGAGGGPEAGHDAGGAFLPDGRLDLNRATPADLETLPGIGPVLAGRIVAHRDEHGPFATAGALREVAGIGEATFQRIADLVVVP